jgi:hypothetical protein
MQPKRYRDTDIWPDNWKEWFISLLLISITRISTYAAIATGAFTALTAERTVNVAIAGDERGIIALRPYDGPHGDPDGVGDGDEPTYARINNNGQLEVSTTGGFDGREDTGVNLNANTDIENVFTISNQGNKEVAVRLRKRDDLITGENGDYMNGEANAVLFYHTRDDGLSGTPETPISSVNPDESVNHYEPNEFSLTKEEIELDPGESITVNMRIDTTVPSVANDNNPGDDLLDSITVIADASLTSEPNTEVGGNDGTDPEGD